MLSGCLVLLFLVSQFTVLDGFWQVLFPDCSRARLRHPKPIPVPSCSHYLANSDMDFSADRSRPRNSSWSLR